MFAAIGGWFDMFFVDYAGRISANIATALVPIALALVTAYIGIYGYAVMRGEAPEPLGTFAWKMVKIMAILSFALPGAYYAANVINGAMQLQDAMATMFVAPGAGIPGTAFGALDTANTQANAVLRQLWQDAGITRLDLVVASVLFSLGTVLFLVFGAFVTLVAKIIMVFVLAIGPLAIIGLIFKPTARFFDSWLSVLLSAVVLSWFVFFALGMSLFVSGRLIEAVQNGGAFVAGAGGSVNALEAAGTYLAVMVLLAVVLYQSPQLASALTGGSSISLGGNLAIQTFTAMKAAQASSRAGGGAAGSGGGAIKQGGGAAYVAGRGAGAAAGGARAAYQRVAQRGRVST